MTSQVSLCILGAPGVIGQRHTSFCLANPDVLVSCIVDPTPSGPAFAKEHDLVLFVGIEEMLQARTEGKVKVDGALHPTIIKAKAMLEAGVLGQILGVSGIWSTLKPPSYFSPPTAWRAEAGTGGPILINLVHDLDLLRHLFGDIVRVYAEQGASTRGHDVEETGACTLKFASGAVGTFLFSDATPSPYNFEASTGENPLFPLSSQNIYHILGTRGSVAFPQLERWHYSSEAGCWTDELTKDVRPEIVDVPPFEILQVELELAGSGMSYYVVLIGTLDNPLYEAYLTSTKSSSSTIMSIPTSSSSSSTTPSPSFSIFGALPPSTATGTGAAGGASSVGYGHKNGTGGRHVMQLVAHASLDVVEDVQWTNGGMYLKSIDKFHEWTVSAWLTPGGVKIIILHELKNDEGIRLFLQEVWEVYVKTLLNPFHELNAPIRSPTFDSRVRASAKKHL
ncbi:hypothetical protein RQP46_000270 [Phenoliferia psychrophenolica]